MRINCVMRPPSLCSPVRVLTFLVKTCNLCLGAAGWSRPRFVDTARLPLEDTGKLSPDGGHDKACSGTGRPRAWTTGVLCEYLRANPKVFLKFKKGQLIFKELKKYLFFFC